MSPPSGRAAKVPAAPDLAFFADHEPPADDFLADALAGLSSTPKRLAPKYFYDAEGSRLFDEICRTDEYYITRTELALLEEIGPDLARRAGPQAVVIEYGSGSSWKSRLLLDALERPAAYAAIDISRNHLLDATGAIARDYPEVMVGAICADFLSPVPLPEQLAGIGRRRFGFFPGSTIGNFEPPQASMLLKRARMLLGPGAAFLLGVDLKKDARILNRAYNDEAGYTAAFNLNVLTRMARELGADIDLGAFAHEAAYNEQKGRIEMHLRAVRKTAIRLAGRTFQFEAGETIHTENSHKYTLDEVADLAGTAGFSRETFWTDDGELFSLHLLTS